MRPGWESGPLIVRVGRALVGRAHVGPDHAAALFARICRDPNFVLKLDSGARWACPRMRPMHRTSSRGRRSGCQHLHCVRKIAMPPDGDNSPRPELPAVWNLGTPRDFRPVGQFALADGPALESLPKVMPASSNDGTPRPAVFGAGLGDPFVHLLRKHRRAPFTLCRGKIRSYHLATSSPNGLLPVGVFRHEHLAGTNGE